MPVRLPRSGYRFDIPDGVGDLVGTGADLEPGTLLDAYAAGLFPMGLGDGGAAPLGWWSPDPRGILRLGDLRVSRSLQRSCRRFRTTIDTSPDEVIAACADPGREGAWITADIAAAYLRLFDLGWMHSVEVWRGTDLVGGLYGVAIGGLFAGESMFHRVDDASKVALAAVVELLRADGDPRRFIDVQWRTPHLATLGVVDIARNGYRTLLAHALQAPLPAPWRGSVAAPG